MNSHLNCCKCCHVYNWTLSVPVSFKHELLQASLWPLLLKCTWPSLWGAPWEALIYLPPDSGRWGFPLSKVSSPGVIGLLQSWQRTWSPQLTTKTRRAEGMRWLAENRKHMHGYTQVLAWAKMQKKCTLCVSEGDTFKPTHRFPPTNTDAHTDNSIITCLSVKADMIT